MNDMRQQIAEMARRYMPLHHAELFANEILATAAPGWLEWEAVHKPTNEVVASFKFRDLCDAWIKEVYLGQCEVRHNPPPTIETKAAEPFNADEGLREVVKKQAARIAELERETIPTKAGQAIGEKAADYFRNQILERDATITRLEGELAEAKTHIEKLKSIGPAPAKDASDQPVTRADMRRLADKCESGQLCWLADAIRGTFKE